MCGRNETLWLEYTARKPKRQITPQLSSVRAFRLAGDVRRSKRIYSLTNGVSTALTKNIKYSYYKKYLTVQFCYFFLTNDYDLKCRNTSISKHWKINDGASYLYLIK